MSWASMSKEELQKQYSCSLWVKREIPTKSVVDVHVRDASLVSDNVRRDVQHEADVSYGEEPTDKLDLFVPESLPADAPILVYFHGGYWQLLSKNQSCFMAGNFTKAGAAVAVVEYELAPKASLAEIVLQSQAAVKYVLQWAANRGSRGVYLCGHSAGGHLVAMMLTYDWKTLVGDTAASLLKGVIPVSGVFDVRPLVQTDINNALSLTQETAWDSSPEKYLDKIGALAAANNIEVLVVVGENDSPEFHRQSKEFAESLKSRGVAARYLFMPEVDHFTIVEELSQNNYKLAQEMFKLMKL